VLAAWECLRADGRGPHLEAVRIRASGGVTDELPLALDGEAMGVTPALAPGADGDADTDTDAEVGTDTGGGWSAGGVCNDLGGAIHAPPFSCSAAPIAARVEPTLLSRLF
jgi:hypothetical protein